MAAASDNNRSSFREEVIERTAEKAFADINRDGNGGRPSTPPPMRDEQRYLDDRARDLRERRWHRKVGWGLGGLGVGEVIDVVTTVIQLLS